MAKGRSNQIWSRPDYILSHILTMCLEAKRDILMYWYGAFSRNFSGKVNYVGTQRKNIFISSKVTAKLDYIAGYFFL